MHLNIDSGETSAGAAVLTMMAAAYRFLNPTRDRLNRLERKVDRLTELWIAKHGLLPDTPEN